VRFRWAGEKCGLIRSGFGARGNRGITPHNLTFFVLHFFSGPVKTETVKKRLLVVVFVLVVALTAAPAFAGSKKKKVSPAPKYHPPVISK
jgi:hypothetical protein